MNWIVVTTKANLGRLNLNKTFVNDIKKVIETSRTQSKVKECNCIVGIRKLIQFLALMQHKKL